jgi:hypothetical protein
MLALASEGDTPSTWLGAEAVAARAVFDARHAASLTYFGPVAHTPGFPRALARTVQELRLAHLGGREIKSLPLAGPDLADLLERVDACFDRAAAADRARLFSVAAGVLRDRPIADAVVLLDLAFDSDAERELAGAVIGGAKTVLATVLHGEVEAIDYLRDLGAVVEDQPTDGDGDLACLKRFLFNSEEDPLQRTLDGSLTFFSAPGEGRESIEIARRILKEARRGVRFDEIAILVRAPRSYAGLLEHALARAAVPAWFDRGNRRPHPAGRAFLALLACAAEHLSAARFAEYLSLAQVPGEGIEVSWVASSDEALSRPDDVKDDEIEAERTALASEEPEVSGRRGRRLRYARRGDGSSCWSMPPSSARRRRVGHAGSMGRRRSSSVSAVKQPVTMPATGRQKRSSACWINSHTCAPSRFRSSSTWRHGRPRARGASGSIDSRRWCRACCARRRTCCVSLPIFDRWPTSVRSTSTRHAAC